MMLKPTVERDEFGMDFAVDAGAAIRAQTVRGGRMMLWVILLFFGSFLVWAYFAVLDEVVRSTGKVIPSSQVQIVQNLEGGIVKTIHVGEGDTVEKGQVLINIDDTRFDASLRESRVRELGLLAKSMRLKAEAEGLGEIPELPSEVRETLQGVAQEEQQLYRQRRAQLEASKQVLAEQESQKRRAIDEWKSKQKHIGRSLSLAEKELKLTRPLRDQGAVSDVEILRLERETNELRGNLAQARLTIPRLEAELSEVTQRVRELELSFRKEARAEYGDVVGELNAMTAGNVALEDRVVRTQVRAPIRGVVKKLLVNTVGGVVQPGMDLVEIVPLEDSLVVEAKLKPKDIAFLRPGLPATVKLTAYDFAIYGGLDARLEHISADTFIEEGEDPYYQVRVRTERPALISGGRPHAIIPGMAAEVDILVGTKTVLDYLLKPLLRAQASALREP